MTRYSASFRDDEVEGGNEADQVFGPLFVLFLVGYAVGLGLRLPWPLAFVGRLPSQRGATREVALWRNRRLRKAFAARRLARAGILATSDWRTGA